jgi:hypothetical protein
MKKILLTLTALGVLAGCQTQERILFDGKYFRTKASNVDKQRDQFTVTVRNASQSIEGAREAGRYEGTRYCVGNYGSSDIVWAVGPDTPGALRLVDDRLIFRGACTY